MEHGGQFPVTRWTLVSRIREDTGEERERALGELCELYWLPVYGYFRRSGNGVDESKDLTQSFFAMVLERNDFAKAEKGRGKLRSYLLTAARHFAYDDWEKQKALKRGGEAQVFSIDAAEAEGWYGELEEGGTAEEFFDRQWAIAILDRAMLALREEYRRLGREEQFECLRSCLIAEGGYAEAASRAGMTEGATRVAAHRMRKRLRQFVEDEVRETVSESQEYDEELKNFIETFAG